MKGTCRIVNGIPVAEITQKVEPKDTVLFIPHEYPVDTPVDKNNEPYSSYIDIALDRKLHERKQILLSKQEARDPFTKAYDKLKQLWSGKS